MKCLLVSPALAGEAQQALRAFVEDVDTLSARFEQVQRNEHGEVLHKSAGRVWLARPGAGGEAGRFRWAYEEPYRQLLVCDGAAIWLYDPDLAQVTRRPALKALAGTPAELLSRGTALEQQFDVSEGGREGAVRIVRLAPKSPEGDFRSIDLWLRGAVPLRLRFSDPLGGLTDVVFSEVSVNQPVDRANFVFTPPPGVEVIEGE